jgi:hypothetical protein
MGPRMIAEVLVSAGLLAVAATAGGKLRSRQEGRRRRRQLRSLAVEHGMKLLGAEEHDFFEVEELNDSGLDAGCDLVGIMEGHDEAGPFALGYRFAAGIGQHFLQFELASEDLPEGLHLHPDTERLPRTVWERLWRKTRREPRLSRGTRLQLQWNADPESLRNERRLATATRWIDEIARGAAASSALRVGLSVQRSKVTLYSTNALSDSALASFYERGMRLRRMMTQGVGASPARRTVRTTVATPEARAQRLRQEATTRPIEAIESVPLRSDEETKIIDISVEELLREQPATNKGEFEVPEPEEEVRVLSAR